MVCSMCNDKKFIVTLPKHLSIIGVEETKPCPICSGQGITSAGSHPSFEYVVNISPGFSFKQAVTVGQYDYVQKGINEIKFDQPPKRTGQVRVKLTSFDAGITTKKIEDEFFRMGYMPADIWAMLAFGQQFPDIQNKYCIVALGSGIFSAYLKTFYDGYSFPALRSVFTKRQVIMIVSMGQHGWDPSYMFLGMSRH
ncbi:MAG: hypothetical protein V1738_06070 [Patescibacteria group bacterium]